MPDRNDPTQPVDSAGDPAYFPAFPAGFDVPMGYQHNSGMFDPRIETELADEATFDGKPSDIFAAHPEQFFTQRRGPIRYRSRPIQVAGGQYAPSTHQVIAGNQTLCGWSFWNAGANGPILLRDGVDGSAPLVGVVSPTPGVQWFGEFGPIFERGVFIDFSQAGTLTGFYGVIWVLQEYVA